MLIKSILIIIFFYCFAIGEEAKNWLTSEDAVILKDETILKITDSNEGILTKNLEFRINNEDGKDICNFVLTENHFKTINDIEGEIKDTSGNIIKELDDDIIKETSFTFGVTLHSDAIKKYFTFDHFEYPFILKLTYEYEYETLFLWPHWYPQRKYPVLNASYKLILEKPIKFKTFAVGIANEPQKSIVDGDSVYFWQLDSIPEYPDEPLMAPEDEVEHFLLFAPLNFATDDFAGSFDSWHSFANWYRELCSNRYQLTPEIKHEVDNLIKNAKSDREKISLLYSYLQDKTRYVAIQLGVGSWQPYSAIEVYQSRFGDCKDLSTFMIAILKQAGINAYPAIVKTRDLGIVYKDFPLNNFNHVITCVPVGKDTIWLETTADHLFAGELPWRDEGCNVFLVTENTGQIVTTPVSQSFENAWKSKIEGEINRKGDFEFSGIVDLTGNQRENIASRFTYWKKDDLEDWLRDRIGEGIPGFRMYDYNFSTPINQDSVSNLNFTAGFKKFGNKVGSRLFINPNILNIRSNTSLEEDEERTYPIYLNYAYLDIDTVKIQLPIGYKLEAAPEKVNIETAYAKYQTDYNFLENTFTYIRYFEYKTKHIPVEHYQELVDFINSVIKSDQAKYVFKK